MIKLKLPDLVNDDGVVVKISTKKILDKKNYFYIFFENYLPLSKVKENPLRWKLPSETKTRTTSGTGEAKTKSEILGIPLSVCSMSVVG